MALEVTVGDPEETDVPGLWLVSATVDDPDSPQLTGRFGYVVGRRGRLVLGEAGDSSRDAQQQLGVLLRSVAIEPRGGLPTTKTGRLTVSAVRDLPLSRWEAAARGHVAQHPAFQAGPTEPLSDEELHRLDRAVKLAQATIQAGGDGRRLRSLGHLSQIAARFEAEQRKGTPDPAAVIAREDNVNRSTVRSWIHRARKAGLLSPPALAEDLAHDDEERK
jgi:hypothetical protein